MHEKIIELIAKNEICVLATVAGAEPHCSLMSYAASDDGREIYMVTHKNTRKAKNMAENPGVSLLIDSREAERKNRRTRTKALTISGVIERTTQAKKIKEIKNRLLARHPHLEEFLSHPEAEVIIVRARAYQLLQGVAAAYYEEAW